MSTQLIIDWRPEIFLAVGIVIMLAYGVIIRSTKVSLLRVMTDMSILILISTLIIENANNLIKSFILLSAIMILLASREEFSQRKSKVEDSEYNQILMLAVLAMMLMISTKDMITMYLAIETMSLSSYIMATLRKTAQYSTEAGLKYIVLGAISSGIILLGISQIYIITGSFQWDAINYYLIAANGESWGVEFGGLMIILAVLFKLGVAPLHMWVPDVYEGSPTIVTMFFAVITKLAVVTLLIRLISLPFIAEFESRIQLLLMLTAIISVVIGSVGAINQTKIKRIFAYSAIAHMGWVVLAIAVGTIWGLQAALIYIILYMVMAMNTFSLILNQYISSGNNYLIELSGLARRSPVLAISFSLARLSIAGVPPLAGFYSKYNIIMALLQEGWLIISVLAILVSVIGAYYYIRIIQLMYFNDSKPYISKELNEVVRNTENSSIYTTEYQNLRLFIIAITLYLILTYLIYPNPLIIMTYEAVKFITV